jgi:hypothetical protein
MDLSDFVNEGHQSVHQVLVLGTGLAQIGDPHSEVVHFVEIVVLQG